MKSTTSVTDRDIMLSLKKPKAADADAIKTDKWNNHEQQQRSSEQRRANLWINHRLLIPRQLLQSDHNRRKIWQNKDAKQTAYRTD